MIERGLKVDLDDAIRLFEATRWEFFEISGSKDQIWIEVPRDNEIRVIELPYDQKTVKRLRNEGFIEQSVRARRGV